MVTAPHIDETANPKTWQAFSLFHFLSKGWSSFNSMQPSSFNGFLQTMHQKTPFQLRKCLAFWKMPWWQHWIFIFWQKRILGSLFDRI